MSIQNPGEEKVNIKIQTISFQVEPSASTDDSPTKGSLRNKMPFLFVGLGILLSIIGMLLFPEFSPIAAPEFVSLPFCGAGLLLMLIGIILIMLFSLRRKKR